MNDTTDQPAGREITSRGFHIFGRIQTEAGEVRVQESSRAFEGAHVWIFGPAAHKEGCVSPHLNVSEAEQLIVALTEFIRAAKADELMEPAERCTGEVSDDE